MDRQFIQGRIDVTKELIMAYEDALLALGNAGATVSYTLDTGQSRQVVTRSDIPALNRMLDTLYNRCATLEARLNGASIQGRPAW